MSMRDFKLEGRARVADVFLQRVDDAGMVRPKAMTVAKFEELRKRLCGDFAYLSAESLVALADYTIDVGKGAFSHVWPPEAAIRAYGFSLEDRPILEHPIVTSWLASVEGPPAIAGGFEVELFRALRKTPVPVAAFRLREIREEAEANARRIELEQGRIDRGTATSEGRRWLEVYLRDRKLVRKIVEDGARRREAKQAGEAAA
jgi:hypothetical protein